MFEVLRPPPPKIADQSSPAPFVDEIDTHVANLGARAAILLNRIRPVESDIGSPPDSSRRILGSRWAEGVREIEKTIIALRREAEVGKDDLLPAYIGILRREIRHDDVGVKIAVDLVLLEQGLGVAGGPPGGPSPDARSTGDNIPPYRAQDSIERIFAHAHELPAELSLRALSHLSVREPMLRSTPEFVQLVERERSRAIQAMKVRTGDAVDLAEAICDPNLPPLSDQEFHQLLGSELPAFHLFSLCNILAADEYPLPRSESFAKHIQNLRVAIVGEACNDFVTQRLDGPIAIDSFAMTLGFSKLPLSAEEASEILGHTDFDRTLTKGRQGSGVKSTSCCEVFTDGLMSETVAKLVPGIPLALRESLAQPDSRLSPARLKLWARIVRMGSGARELQTIGELTDQFAKTANDASVFKPDREAAQRKCLQALELCAESSRGNDGNFMLHRCTFAETRALVAKGDLDPALKESARGHLATLSGGLIRDESDDLKEVKDIADLIAAEPTELYLAPDTRTPAPELEAKLSRLARHRFKDDEALQTGQDLAGLAVDLVTNPKWNCSGEAAHGLQVLISLDTGHELDGDNRQRIGEALVQALASDDLAWARRLIEFGQNVKGLPSEVYTMLASKVESLFKIDDLDAEKIGAVLGHSIADECDDEGLFKKLIASAKKLDQNVSPFKKIVLSAEMGSWLETIEAMAEASAFPFSNRVREVLRSGFDEVNNLDGQEAIDSALRAIEKS